MAELPILPVKTDALLADTGHMSAEEFGAYCRLLFTMWRHDARLVDNAEELARIAGVTPKRWEAIAERVMRPMTVAGGLVSQKRLTSTWCDVQDRRRKNAAAGMTGGTTRWGTSKDEESRASRSRRLSEARLKGRHSKEEWNALVAVCGCVCVKCEKGDTALVKDHIIPLYQGGSDGIENIQPLCVPCNSGKGPDRTDYRPYGWQNALRMPVVRPA